MNSKIQLPPSKLHTFILHFFTFTIWGAFMGSCVFWYLKLHETSYAIPVPDYATVVDTQTTLPKSDIMVLFGPHAQTEVVQQIDPIINKIKVSGIVYHPNLEQRFIMISFLPSEADKAKPVFTKIYQIGSMLLEYTIKDIQLNYFVISKDTEELKIELSKDPLIDKYPFNGIYISARQDDKNKIGGGNINVSPINNITIVPQAIELVDGEQHIVDQDMVEEQKNNGGFTNFGTHSVFK